MHPKTLKGSLNITPGIARGITHRPWHHASPGASRIARGITHRPGHHASPGASHRLGQ
jgi:hypothetical protein